MAGKVTIEETTPEEYKKLEKVCLGMVIPCTGKIKTRQTKGEKREASE